MPIPHDPTHADAGRDPEFAESLGRGHEQRDTHIKPILVFVVVLCISIVVVQFAVWGLQELLKHQNAMQDPMANSSVQQSSVSQSLVGHVPPPEPRLQPSPYHQTRDFEDTRELRERQEAELNSLGKVPGEADRVHVPVDRLIDQAVEKGIDSVRPAAAAASEEKK